MPIEETRRRDRQEDPRAHNDGEHDRPEGLNGQENEELPNGATDGEQPEVQVNAGVLADEVEEWG